VTRIPPLGPLCEQQFWLFGCDVRRPAGNLLVEWGFTRQRQGPGRPTRYLRETASETIALDALAWLADHERPAVETAGPAHRRRSPAETAPCCEADVIPAAWEAHARLLGSVERPAGAEVAAAPARG
jgi:hypothetical protein